MNVDLYDSLGSKIVASVTVEEYPASVRLGVRLFVIDPLTSKYVESVVSLPLQVVSPFNNTLLGDKNQDPGFLNDIVPSGRFIF